ncbi:MAG: helix-turn-helix domain-containing protein [Pyrinomonadaceae bacterium]
MKLAEKITDYLFTNGANQKAVRLELELEGGRNGGGWAPEAARDAIQAHLEEWGITSLLNIKPLTSLTLAEVERELILDTLKREGGNHTRAARSLGISLSTLGRRLRAYKLLEGHK